jgi:hypothetical protein
MKAVKDKIMKINKPILIENQKIAEFIRYPDIKLSSSKTEMNKTTLISLKIESYSNFELPVFKKNKIKDSSNIKIDDKRCHEIMSDVLPGDSHASFEDLKTKLNN